MKILYLFRSLAVCGGIERILVDKMNALASKHDMSVYLLTTDQGSHPLSYNLDSKVRMEDLGINFHHVYQYGVFRRMLQKQKRKYQFEKVFNKQILNIQPDIIVCTTSDQIGSIVKVKGELPLVVESHSICNRTIEHGRVWILRKIYRRNYLKSLSKVDCLVSLTEGDAKNWRRFHPNVRVIPNMLYHFPKEMSSQATNHVIFVGRLDYQKRVQDALLIWNKVSAKFPEWILDIYGDGNQKGEIEEKVASMRNVRLHQPTDHIFDCYLKSSVLISTSLFEPFGLVLIEAMSCGLPVVAFDCQYGPSDIITNGKDGFLIKNRNIDEFVEKVCLLLENQALRMKMGRAGVLSSQRYSKKLILPMWEQLFNNMLN